MKTSIKAKMTLFVAAILVAMMGSLLLATFFLAEPVMIGRKKAKIRGVYRTVSRNYSDDPRELSALLTEDEEINGLRVEVFGEEGELIYTSGRRVDEGFGGFHGMPGMHPERPEPLKYSASPEVIRSGV
ncbi:MAG: hypothetical protein IJP27_00070, partial [Clostridia bacterium]|nr:hypothetical protein [Clostridia bacterium]